MSFRGEDVGFPRPRTGSTGASRAGQRGGASRRSYGVPRVVGRDRELKHVLRAMPVGRLVHSCRDRCASSAFPRTATDRPHRRRGSGLTWAFESGVRPFYLVPPVISQNENDLSPCRWRHGAVRHGQPRHRKAKLAAVEPDRALMRSAIAACLSRAGAQGGSGQCRSSRPSGWGCWSVRSRMRP
jgi:hypothetical protein